MNTDDMVSSSTKEYACVIMTVGHFSLGLFSILDSAIEHYNTELARTGCTLRITLANQLREWRHLYSLLFFMYEKGPALFKIHKEKGRQYIIDNPMNIKRLINELAHAESSDVEANTSEDNYLLNLSTLAVLNHMGSSIELRQEAARLIAEYICTNLTVPFDRFFIQASINNERELVEELAMQCKLVIDRKVGEYFGVDSFLGWSKDKVTELMTGRLNNLYNEYTNIKLEYVPRIDVKTKRSILKQLSTSSEVNSVIKAIKAVFLDLIDGCNDYSFVTTCLINNLTPSIIHMGTNQ
ncbi:hypothetical protein NEIRO03_1394 [Nematocida sp. AWRm78]|nr:hypothetical protein NEIRO02_0667 [Nematocida sp. AWRm79]KAI5183919.1 hypothetical protein NEIRO03_1394 [Nematocida sp. AWRm78]